MQGLSMMNLVTLFLTAISQGYAVSAHAAFVEPTYRWVRNILMAFAAFGFNSTFTTIISLSSATFMIVDYINTHLRGAINNEMVVHDNFNVKSLETHRNELALPTNSSEVDVKIAYLKREMSRLVELLTHPSYKDLTHVQMNTLRGQAREVLANISAANSINELKQSVLIALALRTGEHCNRVYLDTFAELFLRCGYRRIELTLKERATLCAQEAREACFKTYYYRMQDTWQLMMTRAPHLRALTNDVNDFHAYELFVDLIGKHLYLPNQTLQRTVREPIHIVVDHMMKASMKPPSQATLTDTLFSDHYTSMFLINQALDARGKLHLIFQEWCNSTFYDTAYNDFFFDEDQFPINLRKPVRLFWLHKKPTLIQSTTTRKQHDSICAHAKAT